ncbi:MAG: hypothetical protein DRO95_05065 [Candidatus Altiarchaeales archaeon]|nr:MAG: hypothetical protein DRO95_05065 [Candidatus Altiarchaeales archaeon]
MKGRGSVKTGGTHCGILFSKDEKMLYSCEDISRNNVIYKIYKISGYALLNDIPLEDNFCCSVVD